MLIQKGYPTVMYVTGAGSKALSWFTMFSGSSSYALEASNLYAKGSVDTILGKVPTKYVSDEVAECLA